MKALLTAAGVLLAVAAPASAQMSDADASIYGGSATEQTGIDTTTTQSISPVIDNWTHVGRDDSSPMREDVSDNDSRAVGGRAN